MVGQGRHPKKEPVRGSVLKLKSPLKNNTKEATAEGAEIIPSGMATKLWYFLGRKVLAFRQDNGNLSDCCDRGCGRRKENEPTREGVVWICSGVFDSRIKRMEMH
jgi:hypothetical protein